MGVLASVNLVLAFVLEIAMLVAFGVFGFRAVDQPVVRWLLAFALPAAVAVLWGLFLAPKASHRLAMVPGILLSLALFFLAALALSRVGQPMLGWVMAGAALLHAVLALIWRQW